MRNSRYLSSQFSTILYLLFLSEIFSLSVSNLQIESNFQEINRPIQRVGIIGAGIAGLSLGNALENIGTKKEVDVDNSDDDETPENDGMKISIFDSRPSLNFEDGAGVQINGGMSVLHKINPNLYSKVAAAALPLNTIRSRTQPWFPLSLFSGDEKDSPFSTLLEFDIEEIIRQRGGETEQELIVDGKAMSFSIMRGALQEALLNELSPTTTDVEFEKSLCGITKYEKGDDKGIICQFEDGSTAGPFDLIVGCDGIKSNVKEFVDEGKIVKKEQTNKKRNSFSSIYSGIRIIFAVKDGDPSTPEKDIPTSAELRQYFGNGGYGLSGVYGAGSNRVPSRSALYIYRDADYIGPFPRKEKKEMMTSSTSTIIPPEESTSISNPVSTESSQIEPPSENVDWSQNVQSTKNDPKQDFLDKMKQSSMPSDELMPVVQASDRFFELGVYFHNPFHLNGWKREVKGSGGSYCVLAGDAAHAMPPFLGQGANQAIQDAYCLASKISLYNSKFDSKDTISNDEGDDETSKSLKQLLKEYENQRWLPTTEITLKAAFLGYLEAGQEGFLSKFRDVFFFVAGKIGLARKIFLDGATPKV